MIPARTCHRGHHKSKGQERKTESKRATRTEAEQTGAVKETNKKTSRNPNQPPTERDVKYKTQNRNREDTTAMDMDKRKKKREKKKKNVLSCPDGDSPDITATT